MDFTYTPSFDDQFFSGLKEKLPPLFTRKYACQMLGGLYSPKALSNLDSAGKGPSLKMMSGKSILYEKSSFLNWLYSTIKPKKEIQNRPSNRHVKDNVDRSRFDNFFFDRPHPIF